MRMNRTASAFAPATVANVAVGFDILGFALSGVGEVATVTIVKEGVEIERIEGFPEIPLEPERNTATAGLLQLIRDRNLNFGFKVRLEKSIPVGSGLGGSSTSAVAAIVAANALLKKKLTSEELLHYALIGEEVASGSRHADNVGPCLTGGLVFVRSSPALLLEKIKTPKELRAVVILPDFSINTKEARRLLSEDVSLRSLIQQTANLSGFLLGCLSNRMDLIEKCFEDVIIEPQRARLIPSFGQLQKAARHAGALGCSISGSGPAIFALARNQKDAIKIQKSLLSEAEVHGLKIRSSWVSPFATKGASVIRTRSTAPIVQKPKKTTRKKK